MKIKLALLAAVCLWPKAFAFEIDWPHIEMGGPVGEWLGARTEAIKPYIVDILVVASDPGSGSLGVVIREVLEDFERKEKEIKELKSRLNDSEKRYADMALEKHAEYTAMVIELEAKEELVDMSVRNFRTHFNDFVACLRSLPEVTEGDARECYAVYSRRMREEFRAYQEATEAL